MLDERTMSKIFTFGACLNAFDGSLAFGLTKLARSLLARAGETKELA